VAFTIGVDYGTNSGRAIVVECSDGREIGSCVFEYPTGKHGVLPDARDHHAARQYPGDYLFGLQQSLLGTLEQAAKSSGFLTAAVIGIGVDTTGSQSVAGRPKTLNYYRQDRIPSIHCLSPVSCLLKLLNS
jgi:L-ribulokinase